MRTVAMALFAALTCAATPITSITGVQSVSFFEGSGSSGTSTNTFLVTDARLSQQLSGALGPSNEDFHGLANENYDVFFSDWDGTVNSQGAYISVEASFNSRTSSGLNIDWVGLNFSGGTTEYASIVSSFVASSPYVPGSELRILGGPDGLFTAMGQTTGVDRMRVTVGFPSSVPEPSTYALTGIGLFGIWFSHRRRNRPSV